MIRRPIVAGSFYPSDKTELKKMLKLSVPKRDKLIAAKGIIVPHAGYIYSGGVAGETFGSVKIPKRVIVLSPKHTRNGAPFAIMTEGGWETPLGVAKIDSELAKKLLEDIPLLKEDPLAHAGEHSLEVELPFLQHIRPDLGFAPIALAYCRFAECEAIGKGIARVIKSFAPEDILIVASSDMNHFEPTDVSKVKDGLALAEVKELDPERLLTVCEENDISMCGVIPAAVMMVAAKELGAKEARVISYTNSGEVTGDHSGVVGYAGVVIL